MIRKAVVVCGVSLAFFLNLRAQGTFQNLDFESAIIPSGSTVLPLSAGLPSWQVFGSSDEKINSVLYNGYFGQNASLLGPDAPHGRIDGNFTALLMGVSIRQDGQVPNSAESLLFKANATQGNLTVTLGGISVPVVPLQVTPDYILYGGDISSFSGQTAVLAFSSSYLYLDSIEFSAQPIPEPSCLKLVGFAAAAFTLSTMKRGRQGAASSRFRLTRSRK